MLHLSDVNLPGMEVLYRGLGELLKEPRTHVEWVFNLRPKGRWSSAHSTTKSMQPPKK